MTEIPINLPDICGIKKKKWMQQPIRKEKTTSEDYEDIAYCILCGKEFVIGEDGNELGFCIKCQDKPDFPYDLDRYYEDYDNNRVAFKGFETMSRGILENYRKRGR